MTTAALDRRLTMRVLEIWKSLARPPALPRRSQIDPRLFGADWRQCILIDADPLPERSRFAYIGENIRDTCWPPFERQCLSDCVRNTLLHLATEKLGVVIEKAAPVGFGGQAFHGEQPILYRAILLPLAEQGTMVDGVLGAVNYREMSVVDGRLPMQDMAAALERA